MKIGSELQFTVPDDCPNTCRYQKEYRGQNSMCMACPIFNCTLVKGTPNTDYPNDFRLVEPNEFRNDWAKEWEQFFKDEITEPILGLKQQEPF